MFRNLSLLFLCLLFFIKTDVKAQLAILEDRIAEELVRNFLSGESVQVSNIKFTGSSRALGGFNSVATNLGLRSGIILSTGDVRTARGLNNDPSATTINDTPGDPDLTKLVGVQTYDAAVIEFDFSVQSDSVEFRYVFASEEYNQAVNYAFNDVFAFFISGPGIDGKKNIALLPGTSVPIAINNVNNGRWKGQSYGPCKNCEYYVDNTNGKTLQYNGFTKVLSAIALVQPCQTYHIKLTIADAGDKKYDSAIFLEAGSFKSSGKVSITVSGPTTICEGETLTLTAAAASNYQWSTGERTRSIKVKESGNYAMHVSTTNCKAVSDTIQVIVDKKPDHPVLIKDKNDLIIENALAGIDYTWYKIGEPETAGKGVKIKHSDEGCFQVQAKTIGGCVVRSEKLCLDSKNTPAAINLEDFFISADPMPDNVEFGIQFADSSEPYRLRLYDSQKRLVYDETKTSHQGIELLKASGGKYYIQVGQ
ncbi:MAG: choice-of-anchor L domain-containing protein [Bacteroidia bacterium]